MVLTTYIKWLLHSPTCLKHYRSNLQTVFSLTAWLFDEFSVSERLQHMHGHLFFTFEGSLPTHRAESHQRGMGYNCIIVTIMMNNVPCCQLSTCQYFRWCICSKDLELFVSCIITGSELCWATTLGYLGNSIVTPIIRYYVLALVIIV